MVFDSRPRPVRRPARRRVHLLTALALLAMAAGLWFAGQPAAPVPAPRLQVAEARLAAVDNAAGDAEEPAPPAAAVAPAADLAAAPSAERAAGPAAVAVVQPAGAPAAVMPAVAGPRAPPHS